MLGFKKKYNNVTSAQVQGWLNDTNYIIVDVRETFEFDRGHIPGAKHIPLGQMPKRIKEIDRSKNIVVVCASGGRSSNAARYLSEEGYNVSNLMGGMMAWAGPTR